MKIVRIKVDAFGKLKDLDLELDSHFNIIYGRNESGKSTFQDFIRCAILGMERKRGRISKDDYYMKYLPWENKNRFGGSLYLEDEDGIEQTITRNFLDKDLDKATMEFTPVLYDNTINIGQLQTRTQKQMAVELQQYLLNLSSTGDLSLNISKAIKYLNTCQKEIKKKMPVSRSYDLEEEEFKDQSDEWYKKLKEAKELEDKIQIQMQEFRKRKEGFEKKSEEVCELLFKHEFYDEEDIKDCKENTKKLLEKYQEELEKDTQEKPLVNPYLIGTAVVIFFLNLLLVQNTVVGVGCVFFLIAYILFRIIRKPMDFNEDLELESQIAEVYEEFLGTNEITEENYKKFCEELEKYKGLLKQVTDTKLKSEKVKEEIKKLEGYQEKIQSEIEEIKKQLWINEGKASQAQIKKLEKERMKNEILLKGQLEEDLQAISLSKEVMQSLSENIFKNCVEQINEKVSEIVSKMTDGQYKNVVIDSKLEVTVQIEEKNVSIESLSKGTIEQIYLAVRIAIIELLWSEEGMPLLLDDSFGFYDDMRLEQTLHYLYEYYQGQVILFTCQKRELEIANKLELFYRNLTLDT